MVSAPLAPREQRILDRIAQGKTHNEIAQELILSPRTVRSYACDLYYKLGVHNRTAALIEAQRRGLVGDN